MNTGFYYVFVFILISLFLLIVYEYRTSITRIKNKKIFMFAFVISTGLMFFLSMLISILSYPPNANKTETPNRIYPALATEYPTSEPTPNTAVTSIPITGLTAAPPKTATVPPMGIPVTGIKVYERGAPAAVNPFITRVPPMPTAISDVTHSITVEYYSTDDKSHIGELFIKYPGKMTPSTSNIISASISVLGKSQDIKIPVEIVEVDNYIQPHRLETEIEHSKPIFVESEMTVEIIAPAIEVQTGFPLEQIVNLENEQTRTLWLWNIKAPDIPGLYIFSIFVYPDGEKNPSWLGSFEIQVGESPEQRLVSVPTLPIEQTNSDLQAMNTPTGSIAITGKQTSTWIPTGIVPSGDVSGTNNVDNSASIPPLSPTSTPVIIRVTIPPEIQATPGFYERVRNNISDEFAAIIIATFPAIGFLVLTSFKFTSRQLKRMDRIHELENQMNTNLSDNEKEAVYAELKKLKKVKWWQFWKN